MPKVLLQLTRIHTPLSLAKRYKIYLFLNNRFVSQANTLSKRQVQNEFLVSKETVVLRRWERSKQKFGFIKRVDKTKFLASTKHWSQVVVLPMQKVS